MLWQDYVPLRRLLPHAAALVHHGGIGTTAEALRAGTPQLVVPLAHDQFDNAARVAALGVGASLRAAQSPATACAWRGCWRGWPANAGNGRALPHRIAGASRRAPPLAGAGGCAGSAGRPGGCRHESMARRQRRAVRGVECATMALCLDLEDSCNEAHSSSAPAVSAAAMPRANCWRMAGPCTAWRAVRRRDLPGLIPVPADLLDPAGLARRWRGLGRRRADPRLHHDLDAPGQRGREHPRQRRPGAQPARRAVARASRCATWRW